jgi:23S rRNA-/tRNA-specific pseudouridylate synthase
MSFVDSHRPTSLWQPLSDEEIKFIQSLVIYRDENIIAINKPVGLSMQAGARVRQHVDRLLPALTFDAPDKPRIVHRLDKDTSGVVLLARSMRSAKSLSEMLSPAKRGDSAEKIQKTYIAFCYNVPAQKYVVTLVSSTNCNNVDADREELAIF